MKKLYPISRDIHFFERLNETRKNTNKFKNVSVVNFKEKFLNIHQFPKGKGGKVWKRYGKLVIKGYILFYIYKKIPVLYI